ncbi:MAG: hypothetical protein HWE14_04095 [Flavobacteriia bacterium]|nr:hypothetical protein [Flavobacteriia bacterium]
MKSLNVLKSVTLFGLLAVSTVAMAQQPKMQYYRTPGIQGLNVFETPKENTVPFTGMKVRVGGDFALQFQALNHSTNPGDTLVNLGSNFNLPTANLNIDVQLADGVRMNLVTYLSSRHHPEAWVKGGYIQMDKLDFISDGFLSGFMDIATIKIGLDEINYGDAHFRRSDNARAIYNPFVGNYIMDAFTTEAFGEVNLQHNGLLGVVGLSNGNLNQSVNLGNSDPGVSIYFKLGYDKQLNEDLRVRLTGSFLNSPSYDNGRYLYNGDRTGARYYWVMVEEGSADNFRSGRFSPGFAKFSSIQVNPFIKYKGIEFFGIYEMVNGDQADVDGARDGSYTQIAAELIYRFGSNEQFYVGGRYNTVAGNANENAQDINISRYNVGLGWFMLDNVMIKAEYMNQDYSGDGFTGSVFEEGNFNGAVLEAVIGF